jgi:hypothetical protein
VGDVTLLFSRSARDLGKLVGLRKVMPQAGCVWACRRGKGGARFRSPRRTRCAGRPTPDPFPPSYWPVGAPQQWHQSGSLTYGGRNTVAQIAADALTPAAAALRDSQAMINGASAADRAAAEAAAAQIRQAAGGR